MNIQSKQVIVYFDSMLYQALLSQVEATGLSVSDLVNEAVRLSLIEDLEDSAVFAERAHEPNIPLENVLQKLY